MEDLLWRSKVDLRVGIHGPPDAIWCEFFIGPGTVRSEILKYFQERFIDKIWSCNDISMNEAALFYSFFVIRLLNLTNCKLQYIIWMKYSLNKPVIWIEPSWTELQSDKPYELSIFHRQLLTSFNQVCDIEFWNDILRRRQF